MSSFVISGITGQDGAYLARHLLSLGHTVYGGFRRTSADSMWRLDEIGIADHERLKLVEFDLTDFSSCLRLLETAEPCGVYNLAAQSFVGVSFSQPMATVQATGMGALHLLEAVRLVNPAIRFYQASTSELFGKVQETPQRETTPFYPRSPYGVAKLYAHWATINYRESYGIHASCGILFNHESPLRGREFVTRKICVAAAIQATNSNAGPLELGNLDALRDWGYAAEYVEGMRLILEHETPDTFVLATGRTRSVRDFTTAAYAAAGLPLEWRGRGLDEVGVHRETGQVLVRVNPAFFRPAEVDLLIGDASKARKVLGWSAKTTIEELSAMMVAAELKRLNAWRRAADAMRAA